MVRSSLQRVFFVLAASATAAVGLNACSGGGATVGGTSSLSGGNGNGGSPTASPTPTGTGSGIGTNPTATPAATASPTPNGTNTGGNPTTAPTNAPTNAATPTPAPTMTATITPGQSSLTVGPSQITALLGSIVQIGILDPNYTGAYNVTVSGGGTLGTLLNSVSNVVNGTLAGNGTGVNTLDINLANAAQLGLLGGNGNVVTVCEQQNPSTCQSVSIANTPLTAVGANLSSIVFGPSGSEALQLIAPLLPLSNFTVQSSPSGLSVTNLGNGQFSLSAAANATFPITGNVVFTDGMGHTISIPVMIP